MPENQQDEFSEGLVVEAVNTEALVQLTQGEISQQVSTARAYPRSISLFRKEAFGLITQDIETAAASIYALPRGKEKDPETGRWVPKIIKGPSARFAEILAYSWGNCRAGARVIGEDETFVTSQGMFYDLEKNVAISYEVKRRITDKEGNRFGADMIGVTANAACSIALRNAVLKGIPKALWKGLYAAAEKTIMGDIKTLSDRRQAMIDTFKPFGVTGPMLCEVLGVQGVSEIVLDHMVTLQGMLTALQEGDSTVEQMFGGHVNGKKHDQGPQADPGEAIITMDEATAYYRAWKANDWTVEQAREATKRIAGVSASNQIKRKFYEACMAWANTSPKAAPEQENLDAEPVEK